MSVLYTAYKDLPFITTSGSPAAMRKLWLSTSPGADPALFAVWARTIKQRSVYRLQEWSLEEDTWQQVRGGCGEEQWLLLGGDVAGEKSKREREGEKKGNDLSSSLIFQRSWVLAAWVLPKLLQQCKWPPWAVIECFRELGTHSVYLSKLQGPFCYTACYSPASLAAVPVNWNQKVVCQTEADHCWTLTAADLGTRSPQNEQGRWKGCCLGKWVPGFGLIWELTVRVVAGCERKLVASLCNLFYLLVSRVWLKYGNESGGNVSPSTQQPFLMPQKKEDVVGRQWLKNQMFSTWSVIAGALPTM